MIKKIITRSIETSNRVLKTTLENLNNTHVTGYVEIFDKSAQESTHFFVCGQKTLRNDSSCTVTKLDLVSSDLNFMYDLKLTLFDDYPKIKLFNVQTQEVVFNEQGQYLPDKSQSDYKLSTKNDKHLLDRIELLVTKQIHKKGNQPDGFYEGGTILTKFILDYEEDRVNFSALDDDNYKHIQLPLTSNRLNNIFRHFEVNLLKDSKDCIALTNKIYLDNKNLSSSLIFISHGNSILFDCEISYIPKGAEDFLKSKLN